MLPFEFSCNYNREDNFETCVTKIKCSSCPTYKEDSKDLSYLSSKDVLECLISSKISNANLDCIIVDTREGYQYEKGHIVSAINLNCTTNMMAKRAINNWNNIFHNGLFNSKKDYAQRQGGTNRILSGYILIYDSNTNDSYHSSLRMFINYILSKGNSLLFMKGGYSSFIKLTNAIEFIDTSSGDNFSLINNIPIERKSMKSFDLPEESSKDFSSKSKFNRSKLNPLHFVNTHEDITQLQLNHQASCSDVWSASISKISKFLYLGNLKDSQNEKLLLSLGITHIINVTDCEPMSTFGDKFQCLRLSATDNVEQDLRPAFEKANYFINNAKKNSGIVLIHCQAGVSRSVAVVVAYLIKNDPSLSVGDALSYVQSQRSIAGPNLHFMGQLEAYWKDLHSKRAEAQPRKSSLDSLGRSIEANKDPAFLDLSPLSNTSFSSTEQYSP